MRNACARTLTTAVFTAALAFAAPFATAEDAPAGPEPAQPAATAPAAPALPAKGKNKNKAPRPVKVRKIRPKSGAKFVRLDPEIRIKFSRPIDPESITASTITFKRLLGEDVSHQIRIEGNGRKVVLTPNSSLDPGTDYEVRVRFGIRSTKGGLLKAEKRSIFFTDPTVQPFQFLRPEQFVDVSTAMIEGRASHTATLMRDGLVLLAGGTTDGIALSNSADLFDPVEDRFRPAPSLLDHARAFHVAVELSGAAMVIGGWDGTGADDTTEIFDPATRSFALGPDLIEPRDFTAAVALRDGRVLVVGGLNYVGAGAEFSLEAEIFDAASGEFRITRTRPNERRAGHAMSLLADGRVLITGGQAPGAGGPATAEIFDPATETFTLTSENPQSRRQSHTATTLESGWILLADGGDARLEIYDPENERFFPAGGASFARRTLSTASALPGGRVLLAGGFDRRGDETLILESMDLYMPGSTGLGQVVRASVVFAEPRAGHTATTLSDGRVLFAGGYGSTTNTSLATGILFTP